MPFVLDASMTMSWCFADESTANSRSVLSELLGTYAEVPARGSFEIANVLAINERKGRITEAVCEKFLETLAGLDIRIERAMPAADGKALLTLARKHSFSAYDASYLELAKRKGLSIATFDKELVQAARQEGIALVSQT